MERKKYLHKYLNLEDFEKEYKDPGQVTAITISGGSVFTGCGVTDSNTTGENHDYDGRYVLDREIENPAITSCATNELFSKARVFKKGDVELYDFLDFGGDGTSFWWSEKWAEVVLCNNLPQVKAAGDVSLKIDKMERGKGDYQEPWVSYTTFNAPSKINTKIGADHLDVTIEYVGECEFYWILHK